jgi:hypothetical protein
MGRQMWESTNPFRRNDDTPSSSALELAAQPLRCESESELSHRSFDMRMKVNRIP